MGESGAVRLVPNIREGVWVGSKGWVGVSEEGV